MSHPDLLLQLLRHAQPAQAVELRAADVPSVAPSVQAGTGQQAAQACVFDLAADPTLCESHGGRARVAGIGGGICDVSRRDLEKRRTLSAVAGRMFHGTGR